MRNFTSLPVPAKISKTYTQNNYCCINIWGPGYTIERPMLDENKKTIIDSDGKTKTTKVFINTSTFEIARMMLENYYTDPEKFALHKKNASPGHVSLLTKNDSYLSIGTEIEFIRPLSLHTLHSIDAFNTDLFSFGRFPLYQYDLYTLDTKKVNSFIHDFKKEVNKKYTILGRYLSGNHIADNCVTSVHAALLYGGLEKLLPFQLQLTQTTSVTPLMFKDLIEAAYQIEETDFPQVLEDRKTFFKMMSEARDELTEFQKRKGHIEENTQTRRFNNN